jgi:Saxitoxin biosynthesis operon protein SxtJ
MIKSPKQSERAFGVSVGLVLCAIAGLLIWRGHRIRAEAIAPIGVFLLGAGLLWPAILRVPNAMWMRLARALGYVNARVMLTVLFGLVLTPLGLVWRLTGRDPLTRSRATWPGWSPYPARYRDRHHFTRMY